ncbi:MAG: DNA-binding protein [Rhodospirillales bacterium]|jgi:uncharacterized OB-fold protein|nr:DNA-binding protein [Rhodospirillales bacterium]
MSDKPAPAPQTASVANPGPDFIYQEALVAGTFKIQRCDGCKSHIFYPRHLCPKCGSSKISWVAASGKGTIYSTTMVRQRPEAGGNKNLCIVELAEGPRLMSRVDGIAAEEIKIGMAVTAEIAGTGEEPKYIIFRAGEK